MEATTEDLKEAARRHNCKIFYYHMKKLRGDSQSRLSPLEDTNGATVSDKEQVIKRWTEHLENVLNRNQVTENDIEKNEKVCDILE